MIYFIQSGNNGPIKIGYTKNIKNRLSKLKTGSPYPLDVLALIDGDIQYEKELHARFREHRMHGEWFQPTPELLSFIESIKMPSKNEVYEINKNVFRIIFVKPIRVSIEFIFALGASEIKILGDEETQYAFGVEGDAETLLELWQNLVDKKALEELKQIMFPPISTPR